MQYPDPRFASVPAYAAAAPPADASRAMGFYALPPETPQGPFFAYAPPPPPHLAMYPAPHPAAIPAGYMPAPQPAPFPPHLAAPQLQAASPTYVIVPQMAPNYPHPQFAPMQMMQPAMMQVPQQYAVPAMPHPHHQMFHAPPPQPPMATPPLAHHQPPAAQASRPAAPGLTTRKRPAHPTMVWGLCGMWGDDVIARRHLSIPATAIEHTRGSESYANGKATCFLAICDSRHRGTCTKAAECPLIHVEPTFLQTAVTARSACCGDCGDVFTRRTLSDVPELQHVMFEALAAPPGVESLAATDDIHKHTQGPILNIPISQLAITTAIQRGESTLCEEHSNGGADAGASGCLRGKDCPKYHLCRRLLAQLRHALPPGFVLLLRMAPTPTPTADTTTAASAAPPPAVMMVG